LLHRYLGAVDDKLAELARQPKAADRRQACLDATFKSNGGMFPSIRHFQVERSLRLVAGCLCQFFELVREFSVYLWWNG